MRKSKVLILNVIYLAIMVAAGCSMSGAGADVSGQPTASPSNRLHVFSTANITDLGDNLPSMMSEVASGTLQVPNLAPASFPKDFQNLTGARLKGLFIRSVLPHILFHNTVIAEERRIVLDYQEKLERGVSVSGELTSTISRLILKYKLGDAPEKAAPDARSLQELMERVDVVPVSLAVAQAATESGWGRSRIALKGNNLFGQFRVSGSQATGDPNLDGPAFALKSFANISEAVERYFFNLNTHPAYREFRETRAKLRKDGHSLNSIYLAQHLIRYSERKGHYVQDIVEMIMDNDLRLFDRAVLVEMSPAERQSFTLTNYLADTEVDDPKSAGHRKDRA